jgi:hypothetical protein
MSQHSRWLRWKPGDNTSAITNSLQSNIIARTLIFLVVYFLLGFGTLWQRCLFAIHFIDVSEPATQVGHQALLDVGVGDTILAQRLPNDCVCISQGVSNDVTAKSEVSVKLSKGRLDLFEVERFKRLGSVFPLLYLGVHFGDVWAMSGDEARNLVECLNESMAGLIDKSLAQITMSSSLLARTSGKPPDNELGK